MLFSLRLCCRLPNSSVMLSLLFPWHSHPGYFGKVGMRHFHHSKNPYFCSTINVDKLWTLVKGAADASVPAGEAVVVDCVKAVRCVACSVA